MSRTFDSIVALKEHERSQKEDKELQNKELKLQMESELYFSMRRGLSFSFPIYIGIIFCLALLAVGLDNDLFSLAYTEEQQEQPIYFVSSSFDDNSGHELYFGSAFMKELENLVKNFEYTFDLDGNQIFPTNNIKQDIVSEYKSSEYNIDDMDYELLGFKIRASDIKIHVDSKKIDDTETRVDIPVLLAKDIKVSNGGLINLSYDAVDLGSVYGIYNKATDKMTVHVPLGIAAKYVKQ